MLRKIGIAAGAILVIVLVILGLTNIELMLNLWVVVFIGVVMATIIWAIVRPFLRR